MERDYETAAVYRDRSGELLRRQLGSQPDRIHVPLLGDCPHPFLTDRHQHVKQSPPSTSQQQVGG